MEQLQAVVPKYAALIVDRVSHQCIQCLEAAQTIPRLYRRTNREVRLPLYKIAAHVATIFMLLKLCT